MTDLSKLQNRLEAVKQARNTTTIFSVISDCEKAEETLANAKPFHAVKTWNRGYVIGNGNGKFVRIAFGLHFWELTYHGQFGADDEYANLETAKYMAVSWLKDN